METFKRRTLTSLLFILLIPFSGISQNAFPDAFQWKELTDGLFFYETEAPEKSIVNDSKLTILKIDPSKFNFNLFTSTEYGKISRSADCWAKELNLNVVVNAGMYTQTKNHINKGYLKNFNHINNGKLSSYYNGMMAIHPKDSLQLPFAIYDLSCNSWDKIKSKYNSFCQGMRMLDCNGNSLAWDKKPGQSCSMVLISTDNNGIIYITFTNSPFTHQKMISFLINMPLNLKTTIYLEGGPEASLYISTPDTVISKWGTYVSGTWEHNDNDHFWEIPNVLGISKK